MAVKVVHIHLHLAQVLMRQFSNFQVYQHIAAQQAIEKNQIDIKMIRTEREAFLPSFKQEPLAKLQQKGFEPVNNRAFQVMFGVVKFFLQAKELQHQRVFDQLARGLRQIAFAC